MPLPAFIIFLVIIAVNFHPLLFVNKRKFLNKQFEFYRSLNEEDQAEFINRINTILKSKTFIGKESISVTNKMKILIAASFAQLTFGFTRYLLSHYRQIYIYPDAYINPRGKKLYKGETNTNGYIKISWHHFVDGYRTCSDRINLGLHEAAHALLNTIIFSDDHDPHLDRDLIALDHIPEEERNRLSSDNNTFFRDYAFRNIKEFFSVAVECFFEDPVTFKEQYPEFYRLMCNLLNQDPANKRFRGIS